MKTYKNYKSHIKKKLEIHYKIYMMASFPLDGHSTRTLCSPTAATGLEISLFSPNLASQLTVLFLFPMDAMKVSYQ